MHDIQRSGLLAAGNWILDEVKLIDKFPQEQSLVDILDAYYSNGGSAYNILTAMSRLGVPFPLAGIGLVGNDANGRRILRHCNTIGIDTKQIQVVSDMPTSYTIVMSVKESGKRTFFHHRGANSKLDSHHFDFSLSKARIFHLGYLLLLDQMDAMQSNGRTKASEILERAKNEGFITSVDLVSEDSDRFSKIVPTSLPYVDYLFLNEYEASRLAAVDLMHLDDQQLMEDRCKKACKTIFDMGVQEWIIIHFPDGAWAAHRHGKQLFQPSLALPSDYVIGNNGAGDALAAALLMGIHEQWSMEESLQLAVCVAAASLSDLTCSGGILDFQSCLALAEKYGYRNTKIRS